MAEGGPPSPGDPHDVWAADNLPQSAVPSTGTSSTCARCETPETRPGSYGRVTVSASPDISVGTPGMRELDRSEAARPI
jgi:hypothetical protein